MSQSRVPSLSLLLKENERFHQSSRDEILVISQKASSVCKHALPQNYKYFMNTDVLD